MNAFLVDEAKVLFNPWVMARVSQIYELQQALVSTNFKTWCQGNQDESFFHKIDKLYYNTISLFDSMQDGYDEESPTIDGWGRLVDTFICGTHTFDARLIPFSDSISELFEKCLLTANHVLAEFQMWYTPFIVNPLNHKAPILPESQELPHLDLFRESIYFKKIKEDYHDITSRLELENILKEDEQNYGPLLKLYKTAKINKSMPQLAVDTAKSGFQNWINLLTSAALYDDINKNKNKRKKYFREFIIDAARTEEIIDKLHRLIGNQKNTAALMVITKAIWIEWIYIPTFPSIIEEFPTVKCSATIFSNCLKIEKPTHPGRIDKIKKEFEQA